MSSEPTIRVDGLSKAYRIYATPTDRLRQAIVPRLRRVLSPLLRALGRPAEGRAYFNEFWALRQLSFEVARGETVGIIGRNGSGKSTLLQLVCGTLTPTQGQVEVSGRVAALLELGSGFNPEYTGRQNVFLNASVLGLSQEETEARLGDILAFADIGEFIDQPVKTYSSGMAMRLAFAVIAHVDADVLIVDEALAVGDAYFQQKCFRWLREFQKKGTVLFCGHDPGAVIGLCQRAIWLDRGVVRLMGPAKDVVEAYGAFVAAEAMGLSEASVQVSASLRQGSEGDDTAEADSATEQTIPMADASAAFGSGAAEILEVRVANADGTPAGVVAGGQEIVLAIRARAKQALRGVILGFHFKDRLGQPMFVDNTFRTYLDKPVDLQAGETATARFRFRLPVLASGAYSISSAIASGTQENHVQHHFLHDALIVQVHSPDTLGAIFSLPMREVGISVEAAAPSRSIPCQ